MWLLGNDCNEQIIVLKNEISTLNLKLQAQKEAMASLVNSISGGKLEQQVAQTQNRATNAQTQNTATNIQTPNTKQRILRKSENSRDELNLYK